MPTQEELNQLKKDFEELEQLAARLGKKVDLSNIKNDANAIKELLKAWKTIKIPASMIRVPSTPALKNSIFP